MRSVMQWAMFIGALLLTDCRHAPQPPTPVREWTPARFIELPDARVRFIVGGNEASTEAPWVFVHGIGGRLEDFAELPELAGQSSRVLALDLPGFGQSTNATLDFRLSRFVTTLHLMLDRLGVPRARLVCHSLGGQICIRFALQYPDLVELLVLVDSAGTYDAQTYTKDLSRRMAGINLGDSQGVNPAVELLTSSDQSFIKRMFVEDSVALAALSSFKGNLRREVGELRVPTLIVWGMNDKVFPVENAGDLHERATGSELRLLDDEGHVPFRRAQTILRWMQAFAVTHGVPEAKQ